MTDRLDPIPIYINEKQGLFTIFVSVVKILFFIMD